jgi:acetyltransferase-like isoleucine patch superfamily enzyme
MASNFLKLMLVKSGLKDTYVEDGVVFGPFGKISIGRRCRFYGPSVIDPKGGSIEIGDETWVEPFVVIYGQGGVKIGKGCAIAPSVIIAPFNHAWPSVGLKETREGITIEDNVWLGTGAIILDGVKVGKGSVVGAGAIVTADIPPNSMAMGNPARVIR